MKVICHMCIMLKAFSPIHPMSLFWDAYGNGPPFATWPEKFFFFEEYSWLKFSSLRQVLGMAYGLEFIHQCRKWVKTKNQKVFGGSFLLFLEVTEKKLVLWAFLTNPILNRVKVKSCSGSKHTCKNGKL